MKLRITLMTENDKHLPNYSAAEIADAAHAAWQLLLDTLADPHEKADVESVEVIEK